MIGILILILACIACCFVVRDIACKYTHNQTDIDTSLNKKDRQRMLDKTVRHPDYKTSAKITFNQFASFYSINPEAWVLHEWYVDRVPSQAEKDEAIKAVCGVYHVPMDECDKFTIENINSIVERRIAPQLRRRVYFSSEKDTEIYHAFYREVQDELRRKAAEEKHQRELKAETKNTADIIKMVAHDIEATKDLALKQRQQAVDMMYGVVNGDTKKQSEMYLERIKKLAEKEADDNKAATFDLLCERGHTGVIPNMSSEVYTLPNWWRRSYMDLYTGVHSDYVKCLQKALNVTIPTLVRSYVYVPIDEDGWFGKRTMNAVKEFQNLWHLNSDGIVGPDTYRAIEIALGRAEANNPLKKVYTSNPRFI